MRSQHQYRTQKQRELQQFKQEKQERKMIIKQMKNPKSRLNIAKGNAEKSELAESQADFDGFHSARSSRVNDSRLYRSTIARIQ